VAARSKLWVCRRLLLEIEVSNPAGGLDVSLVIVVFSDRSLCAGLTTHPEESYRV
jgi:hypothetical protein